MNTSIPRALVLSLVALFSNAHAQEFLDRLDDALTINGFDHQFRARLSGTIDLEGYRIDQPPPGVINTDRHFLLNPRLTLFLDAQAGSHVYAFVQSRLDRGFDPSGRGGQLRLDEYALRISPWDDGRFSVQAGKFSTAVGTWTQRHLSWDNPFVTAPLPYENVTGIWDVDPAGSGEQLRGWAHLTPTPWLPNEFADKNLRLPIIWGPSYATGLAVLGRIGKLEYNAEIKNTSLSSRPETWGIEKSGFSNPTFSGRIGFRPNEMWNFGFSGSTGPYLAQSSAEAAAPFRYGDYRQIVLGQDISFAWHHFQLWAEMFEARFEVPGLFNADTLAYYIEAKYKFSPQFFGALRWNQQLFDTVPIADGGSARWGRDTWRVDTALGYRFTEHIQFKVQYSFQQENSAVHEIAHTLAGQFTVRF